MAVTLTSYPVTTSSGKVRNIFAGFDAVELGFKREDTAVISGDESSGGNLRIYGTGDFVSSLNVGEWVYINTSGATYTYNGSFQVIEVVLDLTNTRIELNLPFVEITTGGYCNYKQDWFLESKLVDPNNNLILKYPQLLQNDGNPNGVLEVNTSMIVDFLKNEILANSGVVENAREECKVMYREVWREDSTQSFILVDQEPIVIIYSAENSEIEDFISEFDVPRMYEGYPFYLNTLHSLENQVGRIAISFDELDINSDNINTDNLIANYNSGDYGIVQANFNDKTKVIEEDTRYITFNAYTSVLGDYDSGGYDSAGYEI